MSITDTTERPTFPEQLADRIAAAVVAAEHLTPGDVARIAGILQVDPFTLLLPAQADDATVGAL